MKTTLAAIVASAGLATSAFAQANGTFTIEARLVIDGDPNAPTGAGITSYAPSPTSTRVGVSLQARVTQITSGTNTGSGNYGIGGVLNQSSSNLTRFTSTDSQHPAGYQALGRGVVSSVIAGFDGLPRAGFFDGTNNPVDLEGGTVGRNFRGLGPKDGTGADVNSLNGNGAGVVNGMEANAENGAFGIAGYPVGAIVGLAGTIAVPQPSSPIKYALGVTSPWYNLYRVYFDPLPDNGDPNRVMTVQFNGLISAAVRLTVFPAGGLSVTIPGSGVGTQVFALTAQISLPSPCVAPLLALGGLAASRRRRSSAP